MKVLITSSRMPFALGMLRKLAAEGRASASMWASWWRSSAT